MMLRVYQMISLPLEVVKFLPRRENYVLVKKMWRAEFVTLVNHSFGTFKNLMHLDVMTVAVIYQVCIVYWLTESIKKPQHTSKVKHFISNNFPNKC